MRKNFFIGVIVLVLMVSCSDYNQVYKTSDLNYKYEAAKEYYMSGNYSRSASLLESLIIALKGSPDAQESLFMIAMCNYYLNDFSAAQSYLSTYYKTYPKGTYSELARFYSGKALFYQSPDPRLDQSPTYGAIKELQQFLDVFPYSEHREEANDMIFQLQNRLVNKEYNAAKLYYNLGSYTGNCMAGGSNYAACAITAENALKSYPYTDLREELYVMILKSKYELAKNSVESKQAERYREAIDEYYGFKNEFPDSRYMKDAEHIFKESENKLSKIGKRTASVRRRPVDDADTMTKPKE